MGTRSIIQVNDKETLTTTIFYKHWDGYPSDNLSMFLHALKNSKNTNEFLTQCGEYYGRPFDDMVEYMGPFESSIPNDHGRHGDLEFFYIVDLENKNIDVFGGHGTEDDLKIRGRFNPLKEIESYVKEYQDAYKKKIMEVLTALASLNFSVNQEK